MLLVSVESSETPVNSRSLFKISASSSFRPPWSAETTNSQRNMGRRWLSSDTALLQLQWTVQTITRDRIYRRKYWQNFHFWVNYLFNKNQTSISTHLYTLPEEAAVQLFPRTETCQYWGGWCALHRMMWTAAAGTCAGSNSQPRQPV